MMRPKEYLVSIGELPPGSENKRGRLSKVHDDMCKAAAAKDVSILGYSSTTATPDKEAVVTKVAVTNEKNLAEAFIRYPEDRYRAYQPDGTVRSMREACRGCGFSLVGHLCDDPRIVSKDGTMSVPVTILPTGA